jgi:hypothetical protein
MPRLPRRPSGPGPVSPVIDARAEVAACGRLRLCFIPQEATGRTPDVISALVSVYVGRCAPQYACCIFVPSEVVHLTLWVVQLADCADAGEDNHCG